MQSFTVAPSVIYGAAPEQITDKIKHQEGCAATDFIRGFWRKRCLGWKVLHRDKVPKQRQGHAEGELNQDKV